MLKTEAILLHRATRLPHKFLDGFCSPELLLIPFFRSQELGSLLLLCFGRLEELLLMLDSESMEASVRFKILSSDIKLIIPQYPSQQQSIVLDSSNPILSNCNSAISDSYVLSSSSHLSGESIQSSGLVFTDVITSLVFAWTRRKHLQMTERFLR